MKAWLGAVNTPGEEPAAWPMDPGRRAREGVADQGRSNPPIVPETAAQDVIATDLTRPTDPLRGPGPQGLVVLVVMTAQIDHV